MGPEPGGGGRSLAYRFRNVHLLLEVLTHASFSNENGLDYCNERLEFLWDVLELCVMEILLQEIPGCDRRRALCEKSMRGLPERLGDQGRYTLLAEIGQGTCRSGGSGTARIRF